MYQVKSVKQLFNSRFHLSIATQQRQMNFTLESPPPKPYREPASLMLQPMPVFGRRISTLFIRWISEKSYKQQNYVNQSLPCLHNRCNPFRRIPMQSQCTDWDKNENGNYIAPQFSLISFTSPADPHYSLLLNPGDFCCLHYFNR